MAAISLGPIASGLPKDIVDRLMEVEQRPLIALESRKANEQNRLALVQDLLGRLNEAKADLDALGRYRQFRLLKADIARPELMDMVIDSEVADPGEYQFEIKQLAGRSSMLSNGFSDPNDTQIGIGYFSYDLPNGETQEVFIDEDNNTLQGIANKINSERGLDLHALVVDDGTGSDEPWRLIISHKSSGEVNDAEFPVFYFVDGDEDFYLDKERPAQNSVVSVNGFDVEFDSTKVSTLLPGVNIDLKDSAPGTEFTVKIREDIESAEGKVRAVVEKLNEILSFIQNQNTIDESTDTSKTLGGDVTLQNLEGLIRKMVMEPFPTEDGQMRFSDMGVEFQRNGLLQVNENKLKNAVTSRFEAVAEYFAGINDNGKGFVGRISGALKGYTQFGGLVSSRQEGIKRRIEDIDRQIENKQRSIEKSRETLEQKFAALEGTMARLKSQQAQVSSTLGSSGGLTGLIG